MASTLVTSNVASNPRDHIEQIKARLLGAYAVQAQNSLRLLARQLNSSVSHFIHELIQNADDLTYPDGVEPLLVFEIVDGGLLVVSNEVGFNPSNVEAICSVGQSTKQNSTATTGEKGIGFKSIFKAATSVVISSNGYHFSFDQGRPYGMVTPEWKEFPEKLKRTDYEDHTLFFIEFKGLEEQRIVMANLDQLDHEILIFLRQLRQIHITSDKSPRRLRNIEAPLVQIREVSPTTIRAESDMLDLSWRCFRLEVPVTETNDVRQNASFSTVSMALPGASNTSALGGWAYNVLPICQTTFPFLFHADFILNASREKLDESYGAWNNMLIDALVRLFVKIVDYFNVDSRLRYVWLQWLPVQFEVGQFSTLKDGIIKALRVKPVLSDDAGDLEVPSSLVYVPAIWRDHESKSMYSVKKWGVRNLCTRYDESSGATEAGSMSKQLSELGVQTRSLLIHLTRFKKFLSDDAPKNYLKKKSAEWHERLGIAIMHHTKEDVANIPLLPLATGAWVNASCKDVLIPPHSTDHLEETVFRGLTTRNVIHSAFIKPDLPQLTHFHMWLGAKVATVSQITAAIMEAHRRVLPPVRDVKILVSHAVYLYKHRNEVKGSIHPATIWLADLDGNPTKSSHMYHDRSKVSTLALQFADAAQRQNFLSDEYLKQYKGRFPDEFAEWFVETLGVFRDLRYADKEDESWSKPAFTPEFNICKVMLPGKAFLAELCMSWAKNQQKKLLTSDLLQDLGQLENTWMEGSDQKIPLEYTFLPRSDVRKAIPKDMPFLAVDNAESQQWDFLEQLGVVTTVGVEMWLNCIRNYALHGVRVSKATVIDMYRTIRDLNCPPRRKVLELFYYSNAIFIPSKEVWVSSQNCVWASIVELRRKHVLALEYSPDLEIFFNFGLGIEDVTFVDVVEELKDRNDIQDPEAKHLRALLVALGDLFEERKKKDMSLCLEDLSSRKLMPLIKYENGEAQHVTVHFDDRRIEWYLADRMRHREAFLDHAWLADLTPNESLRASPALHCLSTIHRFTPPLLSALVSETYDFGEPVTLCPRLTTIIRSRRGFLVSAMNSDKDSELQAKIDKLETAEVLQTSSILTRFSMAVPNSTKSPIMGKDRNRDKATVVAADSQPLRVYIVNNRAGQKGTDEGELTTMPFAAVRELCSYFHIIESASEPRVHKILLAEDLEEIQEALAESRVTIDGEAERLYRDGTQDVKDGLKSSEMVFGVSLASMDAAATQATKG